MKIKTTNFLISILLCFMFSAAQLIAQSNIIFISPDDREAENIAFLETQGFTVEKFWPGDDLGLAGQDTLDKLNAADLVIIGRSGPSTSFRDSAEKARWHAITAPVLIICPWKARGYPTTSGSKRLNLFNSTSAYHSNTEPAIAYAKISDPTDPIFANATVAADSTMDWFAPPPHDFIQGYPATTETNAEIVATYKDSSILVARFAANVPFYPGAEDSAAGPRTYMGMGNDDVYDWTGATKFSNFFPLTRNAKAVYLAEICTMMGIAVQAPVFAEADYDILMVTDENYRDTLYKDFLEDAGYSVHFWVVTDLSLEPQLTLDKINSNDLVIVGRAPHSSNFQQPPKRYVWNKKVQVPLMLTSQWIGRNSRINWFNSGSCVQLNWSGAVRYAKITDPTDAVFADATIAADSTMDWSDLPDDLILLDTTSNFSILAWSDTLNGVLFARIDPGVEFYDGAGATEKAAAPRTYFGFGNDAMTTYPDFPHFFPLVDNSKTVLLNEVERLIDLTYTVFTDYPSDDATLASLAVDVGTMTPDFDPAVTEYNVMVPQGTTSVQITAVANDANADTVTGGGSITVDVSSGSATAAVTVTAEDKITKKTYNLTLQTEILIDGVIGAGEWDWIAEMPVEKDIDRQNIADTIDYSLYFKMLWSDTALFLLIDVTDDAIFLGSANGWEDDNLEVYFDMDNAKMQRWPRAWSWHARPWDFMDDNDMQLRLTPTLADIGFDGNAFGSAVTSGAEYAQTQSATGYIFELMFKLDSLAKGDPGFAAEEGTKIGFDFCASDNDDNPDYRDQTGWYAIHANIYTDACSWGTLEFNADGTVTQVDMDTEAPTAPANLDASVDGSTVTLTWDASTDNVIVDQYVIYVGGTEMGRVYASDENGGSVSDAPAGTYMVGVSAVDLQGNESDPSETEVTVVVGIDETTVSYRIYPVPASDLLVIENADLIERIEVFDLVGQSVMDITVKANYVKLNTSELKSGVYIMKLHTAGEVFTEQLVIE